MRTVQSSADLASVRSTDPSFPIDLCRIIREGSHAAETELIRKYERGLCFMIRHHTHDDELVKDVVQETFVVVLQRLRTTGIDTPAKLSPFLHQTARNIMIGHLRKAARRRTDADTAQIEATAGNLEDQHRAATREEDALIVRELLEELKCERDREILRRFYLLEEDKADICEQLDLSDIHFNRVLYRARQRFAQLVQAYERRHGTHFQ